MLRLLPARRQQKSKTQGGRSFAIRRAFFETPHTYFCEFVAAVRFS